MKFPFLLSDNTVQSEKGIIKEYSLIRDVKEMDRITKTEYPECGKVVLDDNITTGIMISAEYYEELIWQGLTDEKMFEVLRY